MEYWSILMKRVFLSAFASFFAVLLFAVPASAQFTLQLASFRNMQDAQRFLNTLQIENEQAYVHTQQSHQNPEDVWYKVRLGQFATRAEAVGYQKQISQQGFERDILLVRTEPGLAQETTIEARNTVAVPIETEPPKPIQEENRARIQLLEKRSVTLNWEPSTEPGIGGYRIHYDTRPGPPYDPSEEDWAAEGPSPISVDKGVSQLTLHGLRSDRSYHFSITAYHESSGMESGFSQEVIALPVPPDPISPVEKAPVEVVQKPHVTEPPEDLPGPGIPAFEPVEEFPSPAPGPETVPTPRTLVETPVEGADGLSRVEAGDVLDIMVPGQREMSQQYDVDPNGDIYMMLVGRVPVGGRTPPELEERLGNMLSRYLMKGDRVRAVLVERRRYIQITGGVRYPGWYRVPYLSSVTDLVDLAGGPIENADPTQALLRRKVGENIQESTVRGQIQLFPNDELFVPFPEVYPLRVDRGDILFVSVPQRQPPGRVPDTRDSADLRDAMSRNRISVDRNGYLYIPDVGHFYVNGLTTDEIRQAIMDRLPKYLASPHAVTVSLIEKSHYIDVSGHVTDPGRYNIPEAANAQEALNQAGGAVDGAVMSDVFIIRTRGGIAQRLQINMYQYSITGDPRLLTPLHEEDTLFVPISPAFGNIKRTLRSWDPPQERLEAETESKVRIFGAVRNPGIYEPKEDMDLLDILALSGGDLHGADLSKISIIRDNKLEVIYNLHQFLEGRGAGPSLKIPRIQHGDTVYVRYVELTTMEPKEDKVWYITGKVRSPGQYKLWDQMTVLQAISLAGGLEEWANARRNTIVRLVAGKQENIPFDYHKGVAGKYPELNIYLQANDTIVVP